ncbi:MAG: glycosyltransferase family 9 protein [Phycisphaeraceae bacterium]|nr:glycosyltransferase family 9 protein [Phycisphaeraceae bacterium]
MKTLLFHHGSLGDGVLIWPLLRAIGLVTWIGPTDQVQLAGRCLPNVEPRSEHHPDFDRLFVEGNPDLQDSAVSELLTTAECVISFISNGHDTWATNLRNLAPGTALHTAPTRPPDGVVAPVTDFIAAHLRDQGLVIKPIDPAPRDNPDGPILIHPGSGGPKKCWPPDSFRTLGEHLRDRGHQIIWILGPVEREQLGRAAARDLTAGFDRIEPADLAALGEQIGSAHLVVANDSGPAHLAAQQGVRTVCLFGPTDPSVWAPRGPQVMVIAPPRPAPMNWLRVERVLEAFEADGRGDGGTSPAPTDTIFSPNRKQT